MTKKREIKATQKEADRMQLSSQSCKESSSDEASQIDEYLDKQKRVTHLIDLYLILPDEEYPELVRDYPATFYDTHSEFFGGEECASELRLRLFDILTFLKKQGY